MSVSCPFMSDAPHSTPDAPSLDKSYSPADTEEAIRRRWREGGCFHAVPRIEGDDRPPYSILIPPPNVTAALHLGHAFNGTLQDVLVRYHRMRGANTLWMPGTDHAGIATQSVVEKRLLQQGRTRTDFTREGFIEKVQEWKDEYEATIVEQLTMMGCSCDWDRLRFTMDPVCARAVREAFFRLFRDRLIYRGKRLVNWDPVTRTALADDEVEMETVAGHMWYLRYPLEDGSGHVTVATTRPETMLGDAAVAVNPRDPRAEALRGRRVVLPIVGRVIPIVEDDFVVLPAELSDGDGPADPKAAFATGFLKVTPAHDPNDWEIGARHDLAVINVMAPDGSISLDHGFDDHSEAARAFAGLSREDARAAIVEWFESRGLLENVREYEHAVGHSYRSHVPIEPYLSDQWYVRVTDDRLRGAALRAMRPEDCPDLPEDVGPRTDDPGDGGLAFFPDRYARTFRSWHEQLRDWCISRQLWWGHRIPVWSRILEPGADGREALARSLEEARSRGEDVVECHGAWADRGCARHARLTAGGEIEEQVCLPVLEEAEERALVAELESAGFTQDPDVLDTWFSSALWPLSTMGWPEPSRFEGMSGLLETFNPSSVLSTAREIITLWVSRMVMFNRYFNEGRLPFREVFVHAVIQDGHGQKMSKSLGNGVDPRDIVHSHGADALRFVLTQMSTDTQDVRLPVDTVCPHTGETFQPETITTPAGYVVSAPEQPSPSDPGRSMVTAYGVASGSVEASPERPLARNTSSKFDLGRNFANKLWNATRFALGTLERAEAGPAGPGTGLDGAPLIDRWILHRLHEAIEALDRSMGGYQFSNVADTLYDLAWRDYCDWYLEGIKPTVASDPRQCQVLLSMTDSLLRLLHPVMPFVTETLWPHLRRAGERGLSGLSLPDSELLAVANWPRIDASCRDPEAGALFARVQALVGQVRTVRGERNVNPRKRITMLVPPRINEFIASTGGVVQTLCGLEQVVELGTDAPPSDAVVIAHEGEELMLAGLLDVEDLAKERGRLEKIRDQKARQISGFEGRLSNEAYVSKAKPELVAETRRLLEAARADLAAAEAALQRLD
ncbi:MAG: valine--tRNA ligase [Planctomycetota bacterium]|nr:valine--tRNA ligase [Planctomycetota bacterium]